MLLGDLSSCWVLGARSLGVGEVSLLAPPLAEAVEDESKKAGARLMPPLLEPSAVRACPSPRTPPCGSEQASNIRTRTSGNLAKDCILN